jgi:hypothetical protein
MAWEHRTGGRAYYYFRFRSQGRVRKVYVGKGAPAEVAAQTVDDRKATRLAEREALRAEVARLKPLERTMTALDDGCDLLCSAALSAAGYYQLDRGAWRRRRGVCAQRDLPAGCISDGR